MTRQSTLLLATLLLGITACDKADKAADKPADKQAAAKSEDAKPEDAQPKRAEPAAPTEPEARTVASGLDLDMRFAAFDIINCDSGDQYCQVCKYGPSPKIMAVGTIDDEDFKQDLQDLEALVQKHGDDKFKVFAVIAELDEGVLVTPVANKDALQAQAKALKEELGLSFPVVLPAPNKDGERNGIFEDHYQVKQSRTIMFADGQNKVKYSEVAPADKVSLDKAISAVVG
jgi:hypothetical protein